MIRIDTHTYQYYNYNTGSWASRTTTARSGIAAASGAGFSIFAGGTDATGAVYSTVDVYNQNSNTWSSTSLSVAR